MKALVVFTDSSARHPLSFLLKPGFRHCFVCVVSGNWWLQIDGAEGVPVVKPLTDASFDLAAFWRDQGAMVVETEQGRNPSLWPFVWNNCVGLCKGVLCIRSRAVTPFGLYKHLTKECA